MALMEARPRFTSTHTTSVPSLMVLKIENETGWALAKVDLLCVGEGDVGSQANHAEAGSDALTAAQDGAGF
jgi:hypothetical protein